MGKTINAFSIDENMFTGAQHYGSLGDLLGIVDYDGNNIAFIKNQEEEYVYRDAVIDTSVMMTRKGPSVSERIILGTTEEKADEHTVNQINESLSKSGNLDFLGNGEINVDLGLQQSDNAVFVADDEFLAHLKVCKSMHPDLPLSYAVETMPYEKVSGKTI